MASSNERLATSAFRAFEMVPGGKTEAGGGKAGGWGIAAVGGGAGGFGRRHGGTGGGSVGYSASCWSCTCACTSASCCCCSFANKCGCSTTVVHGRARRTGPIRSASARRARAQDTKSEGHSRRPRVHVLLQSPVGTWRGRPLWSRTRWRSAQQRRRRSCDRFFRPCIRRPITTVATISFTWMLMRCA